MFKQGFSRFLLGMAIGYCLVQGLTHLHKYYFWTLFYHS